ncbi:hypothetical protein CONCODRAFT_12738 [Conidiobolus coronatus NRRL 28638]|uniref:Pentacotripeptide-repeat region of PRORP domain-containing protein n=1 Tax=Conidiobolus coronatus (strain ATCC 28846 / CBS 209.66 / NRRL 28638) TaxID=796925 RepID=A0A137NSE6_CONC2|nr:hypothetical protein CONCODRAFT_12738 [Conidiobolus coronatus NRRL 28638]|eukprot:KXN65612.1 hypothetical protein CONCODRAFT_12738 [Conidiobolus coronatus NRRL 28638]
MLIKTILKNNNRKAELSVDELNGLLISISSLKLLNHNTAHDINIDAFLELIFNYKYYKGGYNSLSIDQLLIAIGKCKQAPVNYTKLANYLITDKFLFSEYNLQYLICKLCFFKQYQAINSLSEYIANDQPELLTVRIFEELIKGYHMDNRLDSAEELLILMKEKNLIPSPVIYSYIITGYGKRKDYSKLYGTYSSGNQAALSVAR